MLAGLPREEKEKYSLKKPEDYAYLNQVMMPDGLGEFTGKPTVYERNLSHNFFCLV